MSTYYLDEDEPEEDDERHDEGCDCFDCQLRDHLSEHSEVDEDDSFDD